MTILRKGAYIPGLTHNLETSDSSTSTSVVGSGTDIIRIAVTQHTYVAFSTTATTNSMLMPAGDVEFFAVTPGVTYVSALQVTDSGFLSITELE
jgi:hypothetical protein